MRNLYHPLTLPTPGGFLACHTTTLAACCAIGRDTRSSRGESVREERAQSGSTDLSQPKRFRIFTHILLVTQMFRECPRLRCCAWGRGAPRTRQGENVKTKRATAASL
jgi:hypothetical protein